MSNKFFKSISKKVVLLTIGALIILGMLLGVLLWPSSDKTFSSLRLDKDTTSPVAVYNGGKIIEACNIVTFEELRDRGAVLQADASPDAFTRTYLEDSQDLVPLLAGSEIKDAPNSCHYAFKGEHNLLDIAIYQTLYSDISRLESNITSTYEAKPDIKDVKVYKEKTYFKESVRDEDYKDVNTNRGREQFILQKGDTVLQFRFYTFGSSVREGVLELIATNFSTIVDRPEAKVKVSYDDPLLQGKTVYKPCELLNAEITKQFLGMNISPVVREEYAGALTDFNYKVTTGEPRGDFYVAQACKRGAFLPGNHVQLRLHQYITEEGAKRYIQSTLAGTPIEEKEWQNIGDQAFIESKNGQTVLDDNIYVRKGTLVLEISSHSIIEDLYDKTIATLPPTERLKPAVEKILAGIK